MDQTLKKLNEKAGERVGPFHSDAEIGSKYRYEAGNASSREFIFRGDSLKSSLI
jgi:hypothetical protein